MIDLLARARPLAAALGRQGRRYVAAECGWDRLRGAWLDAVRTVAAGSPG